MSPSSVSRPPRPKSHPFCRSFICVKGILFFLDVSAALFSPRHPQYRPVFPHPGRVLSIRRPSRIATLACYTVVKFFSFSVSCSAPLVTFSRTILPPQSSPTHNKTEISDQGEAQTALVERKNALASDPCAECTSVLVTHVRFKLGFIFGLSAVAVPTSADAKANMDVSTVGDRTVMVAIMAMVVGSMGFATSVMAMWINWFLPSPPSKPITRESLDRLHRLHDSDARSITSTEAESHSTSISSRKRTPLPMKKSRSRSQQRPHRHVSFNDPAPVTTTTTTSTATSTATVTLTLVSRL
ncbi:hypothetical protein EVG20_g6633, partial [Dentipellis fragilis]